MNLIALTQRVVAASEYPERRDALDQRWSSFLSLAGLHGIPLPNDKAQAYEIFKKLPFNGIILTGGNSPVLYGGDAPERDETEMMLLQMAVEENIPVIGVCRGMQMIHLYHGGELKSVEGHVIPDLKISYFDSDRVISSFHRFAVAGVPNNFEVFAKSDDGVIKGYKHKNMYGIMWHPEREALFRSEDIRLFQEVFVN